MKIDVAALIGKVAEQKLAGFNLHEIVAKEFGVPEITLKTAVEILGRRLLLKRAEYKTIMEGIGALAELEKSAGK
jgi:hypothetical protein